MLFFSCFYLGDFVIPVLSSISAFDRVTIVYFLAVAGLCPRGTGTPLYFRRNSMTAGASFFPRHGDNWGGFFPSQVNCALSTFLVNSATTIP